jgi:ATP phosphoribosyltransferase regulatory subunit
MNSPPALALLPAGLHDLLPPDAEREAALAERAMAVFRSHGYERVKPPLVEFEESLLSGVGRAWSLQTFRLLDPESQRMMAIRADMTLQVARLSRSRLVNAPRPLRLCYAGEVLRIGGALLSPERQFRQIGCELIGSLEPAADAEIVVLAASALAEIGVTGLSIDLNLPTLVPTIFAAYGISGEDERRLAHALAHRDSAIAAAEPEVGPLLAELLALAGPADAAIERLSRVALPEAAEASRARLLDTVRFIRVADPDLALTIDPLERQGFEYQTGLSFTIFARASRRELGRGGRYRIAAESGSMTGEPATGFSLFADAILAATAGAPPAQRVYLAFGCRPAVSRALRSEGWVAVAALKDDEDPAAAARQLGCTHLVAKGTDRPQAIG